MERFSPWALIAQPSNWSYTNESSDYEALN